MIRQLTILEGTLPRAMASIDEHYFYIGRTTVLKNLLMEAGFTLTSDIRVERYESNLNWSYYQEEQPHD